MNPDREKTFTIEEYRTITLNVEGMDCADEQEIIEKK